MKTIDIEKLNQLVSRTDISGNDKVKWLIDFIDGKELHQQEQEVCNHCGKTLREQMKGCGEITCYRQFLSKQETLEEATERLIKLSRQDGFYEGAKWMEERMYSEEDIRASLADFLLINPAHLQMTSNGHGEFPDGYKLTEKGISYIIEQFKK